MGVEWGSWGAITWQTMEIRQGSERDGLGPGVGGRWFEEGRTRSPVWLLDIYT